jgi:hypothetical protein
MATSCGSRIFTSRSWEVSRGQGHDGPSNPEGSQRLAGLPTIGGLSFPRLPGQGRAITPPSKAPVTTSIKWCCQVSSVASQTRPVPRRVAGHQRGKSNSSARASKQVRLTCRLGAALAGGSSMPTTLRYISAMGPSFRLSRDGRTVAVGTRIKIASDTNRASNPRRMYQAKVLRRNRPRSGPPTRYGER